MYLTRTSCQSLSRKIAYILICYYFAVICSSPAQAWDWGSSQNFFVHKPLENNFAFESRSLFATRDDLGEVFFATGDLGISYRFSPLFKAGVAYRIAGWNLQDDWTYENRPLVNFDLSKKLSGYSINNRLRFEFRFFNDTRSDDVRLRNELRIIAPYSLYNLKPYLEEEFFYSFEDGEIDMNWLSAGLRFPLSESVKFKIGYRWSTRRIGDRWANRNVIVTGLLFFLGTVTSFPN